MFQKHITHPETGKEVTDTINDSRQRGYEEDEVNRFDTKIKNVYSATALENLKKRTVGITGSSGMGKSRLIPNILNQPGAAISSDLGSCTHVAHEYSLRQTGQSKNVYGQVHFLTDSECTEKIKQACDKYFEYEEESHNGPTANTEMKDDREEHNTALGLLASCTTESCPEAEFQSTEELRKFLNDHKPEAKRGEAVRVIARATNNYLDSKGRQTSIITFEENDHHAMNIHLAKYVRPKEGLRSPWYFVDKVKTRFYAAALENNVSLYDLPGTSDSNTQRTQSAQKYADRCEIQMVVREIVRAATDGPLDKKLHSLVRRNRINKTIIVLTMVDKINQTDLPHEYDDQEDRERYDLLRRHEKELQGQVKKSQSMVRRSGRNAPEGSLQQLRDEEHDAGVAKAQADREYILLRNKYTERVLRKSIMAMMKQKNRTGNGPRFVFVSNTLYEEHQQLLRDDPYAFGAELIPLAREETGIDDINQILREEPAREKRDKLIVAFHEMEYLLSGLELYCSKTQLQLKDTVLNELQMQAQEIKKRLNKNMSDLQTTIRDIAANIVQDLKVEWKGTATALADGWDNINAATFRAICAKEGEHTSVRKGASKVTYNLTLEICCGMDDIVGMLFKSLSSAFNDTKKDVCETVRSGLNDMRGYLEGAPETAGKDMRVTFKRLENIETRAVDEIETIFTSLGDFKDFKGTGSDQLRKDTMRRKVEVVLRELFCTAREGLVNYVKEESAQLVNTDIGGILDNVVGDFDIRFYDENDQKSKDECKQHGKSRKQLLAAVEKAQRKMESLAKDVEECKRY